MRRAVIDRRTTETQIALALGLEGKGRYQVRTGIRFLDHMLELFARHGGFDLTLDGDRRSRRRSASHRRGPRHRARRGGVEGARRPRGINRAGYFVMPMDETLAVAAVDLGGRPHAVVDLKVAARRVGDLQTELVHDFFEGFAIGARANVHVKVLYGRSSHHKIEAVFKAFAPRAARRVREGQAAGAHAAAHEGAAVIRAHRLRRRQPDVGQEGARRPSAPSVFVPGGAGRTAATRTRRHRARASATSAPRARSTPTWVEAIRRAASATGGRCSASASACSGCSRAARKRPTVPGLGAARRRAATRAAEQRRRRRRDAARRIPHVGWNRSTPASRDAAIVDGVAAGAQVYFTHSYVAPSHRRHRGRHRARRAVRRRSSSAARSPACSSTPRSRATSGCAILRNFVRRLRGSVRCCRNASSPASTSATARSSRASTSRGCGAPAIRPSWRGATTARGSTSSSSSTSRPRSKRRRALADTIRAVARELFIPLAVGGGIRTEADAAAAVEAGADKVSLNTAALVEPGAHHDAGQPLRQPGGHRRHRRQARSRRSAFAVYARSGQTAADARRGRVGARGRGARRRRDPADLDRPRRHQGRLRLRDDRRRVARRVDSGHRLGRRRRPRSLRRRLHRRRPPTRRWPRRSSTTPKPASTRSRSTCEQPRHSGPAVSRITLSNRC